MATLLQDIVALLAISKPLGALPVFLAVTEGMTPAERMRAALRAAIATTIILTVSALVGRAVLAAFGVSMPGLVQLDPAGASAPFVATPWT
jgi:multiple antibiotic resistance protein